MSGLPVLTQLTQPAQLTSGAITKRRKRNRGARDKRWTRTPADIKFLLLVLNRVGIPADLHLNIVHSLLTEKDIIRYNLFWVLKRYGIKRKVTIDLIEAIVKRNTADMFEVLDWSYYNTTDINWKHMLHLLILVAPDTSFIRWVVKEFSSRKDDPWYSIWHFSDILHEAAYRNNVEMTTFLNVDMSVYYGTDWLVFNPTRRNIKRFYDAPDTFRYLLSNGHSIVHNDDIMDICEHEGLTRIFFEVMGFRRYTRLSYIMLLHKWAYLKNLRSLEIAMECGAITFDGNNLIEAPTGRIYFTSDSLRSYLSNGLIYDEWSKKQQQKVT